MPAPIRPDSSSPAVSGPVSRDQRDGQAGRNHRLGAEPLERRAGVHRQHDADRQAGDGDQRRRPHAELVELADGFAELERREEQLRAPRVNANSDDVAGGGEHATRVSARRRAQACCQFECAMQEAGTHRYAGAARRAALLPPSWISCFFILL